MAKRRNYRQECEKEQSRLRKSAKRICDISHGLQTFGVDTKSPAYSATPCEDAEALVAMWEAAAATANDLLMASMNTATEVMAGLQAAYAVRAAVCETV